MASAAPVPSTNHTSSTDNRGDLFNQLYFAAALISLIAAVAIRTRRKLIQDWSVSSAVEDIEDRSEGFLDLIIVDSPTSAEPEMRQEIMIIVTDEKASASSSEAP